MAPRGKKEVSFWPRSCGGNSLGPRCAMGEGGQQPRLPSLHPASPYGLRHTVESDRRVMELQS